MVSRVAVIIPLLFVLISKLDLRDMTKEQLNRSKAFKIALPVIILLLAIMLFRNGYAFGQWLYEQIN